MKQDIFDKNGKYLPGINEHNHDEHEKERRLLLNKDNLIRNLEEVSNQVSPVDSLFNNNTDKDNSEISLISNNSNVEDHNKTEDHHSKESSGQLETIYFTNNEILLFASVISATDAVAALAFVKEESDPKLFPILFGEGVVNDAVCIVLYQIIKSFLASGERKW